MKHSGEAWRAALEGAQFAVVPMTKVIADWRGRASAGLFTRAALENDTA
jgi:hypothetical protein